MEPTGIEMIDRTEALVASVPTAFWFGKRASDKQLMFLARRYGNLLGDMIESCGSRIS